MPQEMKIWKIDSGDILKPIEKAKLNLEDRLEAWLATDITLLSNDLIVIGKQVRTGFGGEIDLLCLDRAGNIVVIELKRDRTPREVVAQVLDYATWVKDLSNEEINGIAASYYGKDGPLEKAFKNRFDEELPETLNAEHKLIIVASEMDNSSERIVKYLSESYGVGINAASFQYFKDNGSELLARVFLIDPKEGGVKSQRSKGRDYDDVDRFMLAVKTKLSELLVPDLVPSNISRWAGVGGRGATRYMNYWYKGGPWKYDDFCFSTERDMDEKSKTFGTVQVEFSLAKAYAKSSILVEVTKFLLDVMQKMNDRNGYRYYDDDAKYYCVSKGVPGEHLSPEEEDNVAKELAWLINILAPQINDIIETRLATNRKE